MDRTPSFYTSRSIVNLSGLSVSDPAPLLGKSLRYRSTGTSPRSSASVLNAGLNSSSSSRNGSRDNLGLPQLERGTSGDFTMGAGATLDSRDSRESLVSMGSAFNELRSACSGDADVVSSYSTTLSGSGVGEAGSTSVSPSASFSHNEVDPFSLVAVEGQCIALKGEEFQEEDIDLRDESSGEEEHLVHKTTSMANFYYKKCNSEEKLKNMS